MNRQMIVQEYFALVTNENGNMPAMRQDESNAGIVAAGIMDLLLNGIITIEKKKITVIHDMPGEYECISSLYSYLKEKPRSIGKLMSDYIASAGRRLNQLKQDIGESLVAGQMALEAQGGLFGNKKVYIPEKAYQEELAGVLKEAMLREDELSSYDMTLIYLLGETKNLNRYFSKSERDEIKVKLKEMKKNPKNRQLSDMINYVNDVTAIMMACVMTSLN